MGVPPKNTEYAMLDEWQLNSPTTPPITVKGDSRILLDRRGGLACLCCGLPGNHLP